MRLFLLCESFRRLAASMLVGPIASKCHVLIAGIRSQRLIRRLKLFVLSSSCNEDSGIVVIVNILSRTSTVPNRQTIVAVIIVAAIAAATRSSVAVRF